MWQAAEAAGSVHACGFNYRFVPAIRRARELLEAGAVGDIVHFRARYLQSWGWDADTSIWRFDRAQAATGAIGDLGTHIIDLARFLAGEIETVAATVRTYVPGHEVDDAFTASIELANGAIGTLEASRLARGRINQTPGRSAAPPARSPSTWSISTSCSSPTGAIPHRAGGRRLVAAGASDRLGRHVHARVPRVISRDCRGRRRRSVLRDVRGRLPRRRGLRRDPAVLYRGEPHLDRVPLALSGRVERLPFGTMPDGTKVEPSCSRRRDRAGGRDLRRYRPAAPRPRPGRDAGRRRARLLDAGGVPRRRQPLSRRDRRSVREQDRRGQVRARR